ncbi:MAG: antibiotic biosynthesis monooxygenase [Myxococcota bacterium]|jgi:heme-degrading monooxygenase HmoA|nr:antibiotic biosynthesis monooxygenase [Myxococcota bacterium]
MVIIVFRSRLRTEYLDEFRPLAQRMLEIAEALPGFISSRDYRDASSESCSVIEFDSLENLETWRKHPEHLEAQRLGRDRFYSEYTLQITQSVRESRFER